MRRLSTRQLIVSLLLKDIDMPLHVLMVELEKHDIHLSNLVVSNFRSAIREVLVFLVGQRLLDLSGPRSSSRTSSVNDGRSFPDMPMPARNPRPRPKPKPRLPTPRKKPFKP
jgi:hypothetical protein